MADEKKKKLNDVQDQVRKQLEDLLLDTGNVDPDENKMPVANDSGSGDLPKAQHPSTKTMDYYKVKGEVEDESKKILKGVIDFYLEAKVIKQSDYVKYRKKIDEMTVSNILFSLKTCQHAIIKLLEDIDMGNLHPRIFEVFGQLQNQMMVIVKHQAAYMVTLEEGYKKIQEDHSRIEQQRMIESGGNDTIDKLDGGKIRTRGTKALMEGLKKIEDVKFEESKDEKKISLTDPMNRPENTIEGHIKPLDEDDESFAVDDDMF